ncbi:MAG: histidine kinase [bacterium]|nr:histidine kinase [bacterium]
MKTEKLVETVKERCRMCYTCVRDCPAKAIRISNGQAEVINDRCIGCGNCVLVCTQGAKKFNTSIEEVNRLLKLPENKIAIVAPSFPASFQYLTHNVFVSLLKKLGFNYVCEVAFGADLVAFEYRKLLASNQDECYIATTCPGVVSYIEKYHPSLVNMLSPIASPMIISARSMKMIYGQDSKVIFIGPCIAKKDEALKYQNSGDVPVDAVLTFWELKEMLKNIDFNFHDIEITEFDPPKPGLGALFPLSGGMLQAADMKIDLLNSHTLLADGKDDFVRAIKEIEVETFDARLVEILCCRGCIMGAGMGLDSEDPYFMRRTAVSEYVSSQYKEEDSKKNYELYESLKADGLEMKAEFKAIEHKISAPSYSELKYILENMGKFSLEDELNCGACGYQTCKEHAVAIHSGLAENEMCLPYTIERLKSSLEDLKISKGKLEKTREALFNAEKLASMGQLSAGIAHEINNPLGVILLNANVLLEDIRETQEMGEYQEDIELIVEQAERCKKIVSGLLNFARKNTVIREPTNMEALVNECMKSIMRPDNINISISSKLENPVIDVQGDKIMQVLVNLINNSIDAMPDGGNISLDLSDNSRELLFKVKDNGHGIKKKYLNKIFEPLFTTKQIGKGTGLGLAVSYGIIKMHKGSIGVVSNTDNNNGETGTEFTVSLPKKSYKRNMKG